MSHVRILTCNLFNGGADPAAFSDVLSRIAPDVVAAQELAFDVADVLAAALPHGHLAPSLNYRGVGLAMRYPGDVSPFPLAHRNGLSTTLDPSAWPALSRPLDILNVHLANPIDRPWRDTSRVRRDQVASIIRHVARSKHPLAVVGDFNATPIWPVYRRLIRVLRDGVHDTGTTHRTWGPWWRAPRLLRIDHALVRGGVRVTAARTVRIKGADHSGLVIDVDVH